MKNIIEQDQSLEVSRTRHLNFIKELEGLRSKHQQIRDHAEIMIHLEQVHIRSTRHPDMVPVFIEKKKRHEAEMEKAMRYIERLDRKITHYGKKALHNLEEEERNDHHLSNNRLVA